MILEKTVIELKNLTKNYEKNKSKINILNEQNIKFKSNNLYAIMGHSGSGKSTLINILGLIEKNFTGDYYLFESNVRDFRDKEISQIRMKNIGFVFQDIYLDPNLKAYENVVIPMLINKNINKKDRKNKAINLLKNLGLSDRINHYPNELSGGEQQRVAIARCLANDPSIILADEPTGNLDKKNEEEIFLNLKKLSNEGKCIIVVSHSENIKKYASKLYILDNGILSEGEV